MWNPACRQLCGRSSPLRGLQKRRPRCVDLPTTSMAENASVEIPPDPQILAWGVGHKPITLSCTIRAQAHLGPKFGMVGPGWFEAMTCNIWLRLEYRLVDSAWFFSAQLWYFHPQGPFLGPQIPDLDPGWAGDLFGQKWDPKKHDFVEKVVPHRDSRGSVRGKWIVWYPGGLWARPFPPKPYQKIIL